MEMALGQRLRELPGPLLLTGHTGFKGTWMTFLLEHLNVPVVGYSLPAEKDSLFDRVARTGAIPEEFSDIRDYASLEQFIDLHKPSTIIHMAAQPLVLKSYESPRETFEVNVMGTVNVLDIAFRKDFVEAIIVVTTDKVYRNNNSGRAFIETDPLEGKDPYSASKVGTESVVAAWQQIARVSGGPKIISVRAGNVIGGGDFAQDRLIPDLVRGAISGKSVQIRNPNSTRPWQHVLDPLRGYFMSLEYLLNGGDLQSLNFGTNSEPLRVSQLAEHSRRFFKDIEIIQDPHTDSAIIEAKFLNLDARKSQSQIGWGPLWSQNEALEATLSWWKDFLDNGSNPETLCKNDITRYLEIV
jgi:CDP-glucose 4,6-dehydratase